MIKIYKCTLKTRFGIKKEQFFLRGEDALDVLSKIQICQFCDGSWTIELMYEEQLFEEGLDFWAHYGEAA